MFDNIFAAIEKWMRELLSGMVESNLSTMFTAVNQQTSEIAAQVGQTPQGWNSSIFSMIRNISDSVVIPIAGIIITLILCYELISMLTERNNLHDVDTWMFFKYFVKMWIAVYLVSHTFDIAMAVFDIGQSVVNSSSGIIRGNTAIDISSLSMQMQAAMATMAIGELVTLALETLVVSWCLKILSVVITVIMYGRMIEIYLYTSLAPIPFATMSNREWGHVGTNYFRGLFALAFQAFLMMVCVAIYAVLILDAGHGGEDGGAVAPDGTVEADINLEIALRARAIAELTGVRVIMTRESAQIAYPDDAATVAQRKKADQHRRAELVREMDNAVLISIHQNCYPDRKPSGAQVLYAASTGSDTLGIQMHDNLVTYLDPQNRRVAAPISEKIYLMHAVQCPAVLVECGFLSNVSECAKLKDADYQAKLATVIIASYLQYRQSLPQTGMIT